jgi:uncharacterized protein (DUF1810 family)
MAESGEPYDLGRFVTAQEASGAYDQALAELRSGEKSSHWMWFVFPQLAGLGKSPTARFFALSSLGEARAYARHHLLGRRLRECTAAVLAFEGERAEDLLGPIDALKLRSSMTLFGLAEPSEPAFRAVLDRFYGGKPDAQTLGLLGLSSES